jgi:hypothetical protein
MRDVKCHRRRARTGIRRAPALVGLLFGATLWVAHAHLDPTQAEAPDGAQLYSALACSGVHLIGCSGEMKLMGGTGRFRGISGGGTFTMRSDLYGVEPSTAASAAEEAHGIIFWPELTYTLP